VRTNGSAADFTPLSPRQPLTPTPYALFASDAAVATTLSTGASLSGPVTVSVGDGPPFLVNSAVKVDNLNADFLDNLDSSAFWKLGGNNVTSPTAQFLGTTNNQALEFKVNGQRALRLEPNTNVAPNMIGGAPVNYVSPRVPGATIGGGGVGNVVQSGALGATLGGGNGNTIVTNARNATIGGGEWNTIQRGGTWSTIAGGQLNAIQTNTSHAIIGGGGGNVILSNSLAATLGGGWYNTIGASATYATIPGGAYAVAANYGQWAYAGGAFAAPGDAQASLFVLRTTTSDASQTELFLDNATQRMKVPLGATWTFDILVVGRSTTGQSAGYTIKGLIENFNFTTALVGTPSIAVLAEDVGAWAATVEADDVNNTLVIKVTGSAGATVRWVASVRTVEVTN
jgi:hypothetical protein